MSLRLLDLLQERIHPAGQDIFDKLLLARRQRSVLFFGTHRIHQIGERIARRGFRRIRRKRVQDIVKGRIGWFRHFSAQTSSETALGGVSPSTSGASKYFCAACTGDHVVQTGVFGQVWRRFRRRTLLLPLSLIMRESSAVAGGGVKVGRSLWAK